MKVAPRETERFLTSPPASMRAALIFGADEGMVRMRRDSLLKALKIDRHDAFACTELSADAVEANPSLLFEALQSMSLTGQSPCVIVEQAGHKLTEHVKAALENAACSNTLILTAGDLAKGSLRTLFEDARRKECMALPCYRDEGADLATFIRQFLTARQITYSRQVMDVLTSLLGNDRAVTQSELEKIDLYLGKERVLTEEIVLLLLSDNQHMALSEAALTWAAGDMARFMSLSERLFREGEHPVAFVRVLLALANRLLALRQSMSEGMSAEQAMASARPPVFYKEQPRFLASLKRFSASQLVHLIGYANQLEASLKRTAIPEMVLMQKLTIYRNP